MGLAWVHAWVQARFESVVQVSWTVTLTQKRIWQQLLSLCDIRFAYHLIIIRFHTFEEKFSSLSFVSDAKQNSIVNLHKIFMYRSQNPSLKACISNISEKKNNWMWKWKLFQREYRFFSGPCWKRPPINIRKSFMMGHQSQILLTFKNYQFVSITLDLFF